MLSTILWSPCAVIKQIKHCYFIKVSTYISLHFVLHFITRDACGDRAIYNSGRVCIFLFFFLRTVEPRFNEVAGNRVNLFIKSRVRYTCIENLDIMNLRGNDQNVRYIEV